MTRATGTLWLRGLFTVGAAAWVVLLVVSPRWGGAVPGETGSHGLSAVAALVHVTGARVCHQRPERSFRLHGRQMPVCGRCTGLYVSGAVGVLAAGLRRRRRRESPDAPVPPGQWATDLARSPGRVGLDPRAGWLALAAAPTLLTWAMEVAGLWDPGTPLRALSALPLGLGAGWLVGLALRD